MGMSAHGLSGRGKAAIKLNLPDPPPPSFTPSSACSRSGVPTSLQAQYTAARAAAARHGTLAAAAQGKAPGPQPSNSSGRNRPNAGISIQRRTRPAPAPAVPSAKSPAGCCSDWPPAPVAPAPPGRYATPRNQIRCNTSAFTTRNGCAPSRGSLEDATACLQRLPPSSL